MFVFPVFILLGDITRKANDKSGHPQQAAETIWMGKHFFLIADINLLSLHRRKKKDIPIILRVNDFRLLFFLSEAQAKREYLVVVSVAAIYRK